MDADSLFGYPIALTAGMLLLPKPPGATGITARHLGNLGLVVRTLGAVLLMSIAEPALRSSRSELSLAATFAHWLAYIIAAITALYLLWSYRWRAAHWPLVLIILGTGVHSTAFIADMHARLAGTYRTQDWLNAAWIVALGSVACAAHEHAWAARHHAPVDTRTLLKRERWIEATMPALLLLIIAATAVGNAEWITTRVVYALAAVGALFAVLLGVREAWIQREEQRLLAELNHLNANLLETNQHLSDSEQRYRHLNQELEFHVAERTRNLQRAYEELESFSYAVAHDLKAPLRAVDGFGVLLEQEFGTKLDEQGRGYLARMRRGAVTMAHLVDDLLAYARIDRRVSHVANVALFDLVRACIEEQRADLDASRIALRLDVPAIEMALDSDGLTIAIRNVLQNAVKFSSRVTQPEIAIAARHDGARLSLTIRDNGIGFDMQYHDRIFAMFQRLHRGEDYPGTGIGLAIARKAVERAGGRIWAQSSLGAGATFFIELPAFATATRASA